MSAKIALFAFQGEIPCFIHVMLNAIDLHEKGVEVRVVLEGQSPRVLAELARLDHPMHALLEKTKSLNLIDGVCKACAVATKALDAVEREGLPLLEDMHGHAGMAAYVLRGYQIVTM